MKEKITGIVLGSIRHSDRFNVTNIFTLEKGQLTLLTSAGSGKSSRQASSRLQPLSMIEAQVSRIATHEMGIASGIHFLRVWRSIYYEPEKAGIAYFLSEFLMRLLRDAPPEANVWKYVTESIEYFDSLTDKRATANFHITFLLGMTRLMGIQPDLSGYTEGMEFDMQAGIMTLPFPGGSHRKDRIDSIRSKLIPKLERMNYSNSRHFKFRGKERSELLDLILKYYGCHFPGCDRLKSLEILKEIYQ